MKIIAGTLKGRNFYRPKDIRPSQNITRKAVFDLLGQTCEDQIFLDLFAGSGSIGLEALSRGAERVMFVEKDEKAYQVIRENLDLFSIINADVINMDAYAAIKYMANRGDKFDIIYIDPPYGRDMAKKALKVLGAYDIFKPNCWIIVEHNKREDLPDEGPGIKLYKRRNFGSTILSIYNSINIKARKAKSETN